MYKMCTVTRPNLLADCQLSVVRPRKIGTNHPLQWVVVDETRNDKPLYNLKKKMRHITSQVVTTHQTMTTHHQVVTTLLALGAVVTHEMAMASMAAVSEVVGKKRLACESFFNSLSFVDQTTSQPPQTVNLPIASLNYLLLSVKHDYQQ